MRNETTGPPFGPIVNGTLVIVFYEYRPVSHAALASVALFGLASIAHLIALIYYKAWHFIPFLLGGICETFGYYFRHLSHSHPRSLGPWISQNLLILAAAPFIAASVYMCLGRIANAAGAHRNRWISKIYILLDVVVLFSQLAGTVMPASGDPDIIKLSMNIILGGLIVQLVALIGFFCYTWKVRRALMQRLEAATALIIARSTIRMVEYIEGDGGYIISHEAFIYAGDAALMLSAMVLLLFYHPGRIIKSLNSPQVVEGGSDGYKLDSREGMLP